MDLTVLKNSGRLAEDKIDVALDITILVKLPSILGVKRILPRQKTAVFKYGPVGLGNNRNRL